ncbi:MAG: S-ribosylhomocysteine lyase [Ruminococcaceae bacterium]|nr:S-ribosylhomocysteine lyase [Oscillospiraceae bacterium]
MKKIASFTIDHTILPKGMYVSRVDGDVTTYDIRMRRPNVEEVLTNGSIHTIEHLFATYVRNSEFTDNIIYFGPMGCRTGCYFLTRGMDGQDVIKLAREAFEFIASYEGEIPGVSAVECGNYRDHDLERAKIDAADMVKVLAGYTNLEYPTK